MSWLQDVRFAVRGLRRSPGVSAVAALSLALGIGAVTSMWSATDALVFRPLAYDPDQRLVFVGTRSGLRGGPSSPSSIPDFLDLRGGVRTAALAAYRDDGVNVGRDPAEWATARGVSHDFFDVLGVTPVSGRAFTEAEARQGAPVVILAHEYWTRRFGSAQDVLGLQVAVDGALHTVVGVLPPGFEFGRGHPQLYRPLALGGTPSRAERPLFVVGRMHGPDLETTRRELAALGAELAARHPDTNTDRSFQANRARDEWFGGATFQQGMTASIVATLLVLLIACANVANLLLAKGSERTGEIALRQALGAGAGRVLRQLLTEALVLAMAAGALGVVFALAGVRGLALLMPAEWPGATDLSVGVRTLVFAGLVSAVAALLFGAVPAVRTMRNAFGTGLAAGGRGNLHRRGGNRMRWVLVAAETTLAVVLVTTTALVVRSVVAIRAVDTGMDTAGVVAASLEFPATDYPEEADVVAAIEALEQELRNAAGGRAAGLSVGVPGRSWRSTSYGVDGSGTGTAQDRPTAIVRYLTPGYLTALGVGARQGRLVTAADTRGAPDVVLVSERFVAANWPGEDALGRVLQVGDRSLQVVGVLPDLRELGPTFPAQPTLYLPLAQWPQRSLDVLVRDPAGAARGMAVIRAAVEAVDPGVAIHGAGTVADILMGPAEQFTALGRLLTVLAVVALVLALVGVYAAVAYTVSRRVPEIGLRMALGADGRTIRRMVLRSAGSVSLAGLAVGLALSAGAARGMSAFMFGLGARDPRTFLAVGGALLAVSLAAAWIPARRAAAVDPAVALRSD